VVYVRVLEKKLKIIIGDGGLICCVEFVESPLGNHVISLVLTGSRVSWGAVAVPTTNINVRDPKGVVDQGVEKKERKEGRIERRGVRN